MRRTLPGMRAIDDDRRPATLLGSVPHRLFFLAGVAALAVDAAWWAWTICARAGAVPPPPAAIAPTALHAFVMLYGFAPFFMFGFLFTAGPRWLGLAPPPPSAWRAPGLLAAVAALSWVPLQALPPIATQVAAALYALGWGTLLARFVALIRRSPAPDRVHATLVAIALATGLCGVVAFALGGAEAYAIVKLAGLWLFLLPVFVVVCHRMIPFFTSGVVPFVTAFRPGWLLAAMIAAPVAHGLLDAAGWGRWTFVVDAPAAILMLAVTIRWGFAPAFVNRLLAMLHVGFVWYAIGFALFAASSLMQLAGGAGLGLAPMHALTIGFATSLLVAMVTRVSCGHTGRTLQADRTTWALFLVLQAAAVARVGAELVPSAYAYAIAAALFAASVIPWSAKYAPLYWRPRADGKPG